MKKTVLVAAVVCAAAVQAACKFPGCKEPNVTKSQFCERHTCSVEGCNAGVKLGGVPGWAQAKPSRSRFSDQQEPESTTPTRIVWRQCPKHACGRFCPRLSSPNALGLLKNKTADEVLNLMACPNERLNKGKFCLEHSCGHAKCPSMGLEEWSVKAKSDKEYTPEWADLKHEPFCMKHMSLADKNPYPREGITKETCSEYVKRIQEEKAAAAAAAAEKQQKK